MTRIELADAVYNRHGGLSKAEAADLVDVIFNIIKRRLVQHERVQIVNFGIFEVRNKRGREGRNPRTGEKIQIRQRRTLVFRPSRYFQDAVQERLKA
ncbi:MAG TPA: HU family DNA-binding protein [Acidobacteriota bacterium]|jgi:integration host factor subunit alpha